MKRLLLVCLATAALAVLLFLCIPGARRSAVAQRDSAEQRRAQAVHAELALDAEPAGDGGRGALAVEATGGAGSAAGAGHAEEPAAALRVVSTLGLLVNRAFVAGADGLEREVALGPDGALPGPLALPCDVRAVGHRSARATAPGIVELEPVFGLSLHVTDRSKVIVDASYGWGTVETYDEVAEFMACGLVADDTLALAVDWGRAPEAGWAESVSLSLSTADNRLFTFGPTPGTLGTFEERLDLQSSDLATLSLAAVCPHGCGAPPRIELWAEFPRSAYGEWLVRRQPAAWGMLQIQEVWNPPERTVEDGAPQRAVSGQEYGASALCPDCGAYGRRFFTVEPGASRVEVPLDCPPVLLRASVDPELGERVRFEWSSERERGGKPKWLPELMSWSGGVYVPVAPDGTLELRLPRTLPRPRGSAWPMPPLLRLGVQAGGCEELVLWIDLPAGGVVDLGRLPLRLSDPQVVLGPGHGIADAQAITAESAGSALWFPIYHAKDCLARADGALAIRLDPDESVGDPSIFAGASRPTELLVADGQLRVRAFAWDGEVYAPLPEESRTLRVECSAPPGGAQEARFGIRWHGLDQQLGWGASAGTSKDWAVTWPAGAELFWWSLNWWPASLEPGRGGTTPITPGIDVLRIP